MIEKVLKYLNHYYPISIEGVTEIVSDGLVGTFNETYAVGQYVYVKCSILNDGVYQITAKTPTKLTLSETLLAEDTDGMFVYGLAIPRDLLKLIAEIQTYGEKEEGLSSESIDDYSVSFKDGSGWQATFRSKLAGYRNVYSDLDTVVTNRNWQNRYDI